MSADNSNTPTSLQPLAQGGAQPDVNKVKNRLPTPVNVNAASVIEDADGANDGMEKIRIRGGHKLNGTIRISGAKNAALPLMCASLLTNDPLELDNMPVSLRDIRTLGEVLKYLGVAVAIDNGRARLHLVADNVSGTTAPYDLVRKMRASVLVLGPLLARFGQAKVSLPGGCAIGSRPVDLHIKGLEAMGATITIADGYIYASAPEGLKGADFVFPKVSVGATENLMMAASLATGTTRLINAAMEPEIGDLAECLNKMGAKITGIGTSELVIEGVPSLSGTVHSVLPDRIETGTFLMAVAMTGGDVLLENTCFKHLQSLVALLRSAGVSIEQTDKGVRVAHNGDRLHGFDVMTEPHPGFPTDLQAQIMALMTIGSGAGMVTETVFENRFMHVPELCRMGASITAQGNSAIIRGVEKLKGAPVMATDLRASVALVLAGLVADGETVVNRIYHLDRGYENIAEKLGAVGADIARIR